MNTLISCSPQLLSTFLLPVVMVLNSIMTFSLAVKVTVRFHIPGQFLYVCKYEGIAKCAVCLLAFQLENSWVLTMPRYLSTQSLIFPVINGILQRQNSGYGGILMTSSSYRSSGSLGIFRIFVLSFIFFPLPGVSFLQSQETVSVKA